MTFEEIVTKVKKMMATADTSEVKENHLAYQINIVGEGEGIFYIEYDNGKINVEPYDYKDRDASFTAKADLLFDIIKGKSDKITA